MSKIKIVIDTESLIDVSQAIKMLQALEGTSTTVSTDKKEEAKLEETKADESEKPKRQRKSDGKKDEPKEQPKQEVSEAEETEEEETKKPETKKEKSDSKVTIDELRTLLAEKVTDHRQLIKNKLTELEASSVSTLGPEHYQAFHDFLDYL